MIRPKLLAAVLGAALAPVLLGLTGAPAQAQTAAPAVVTLTYDASQSGTWADAVKTGVGNWNSAVHNVRLVPVSSGASADVVYVATDGWPQATLGPIKPGGQGEVQLGKQATDEGYDATRIAAHETGHILGLGDHYEGPCSEIMSGHGPGTSCTNAHPDANEAAQVDQNYAGGTFGARPNRNAPIVIDVWANRALASSR